MSSVFGKVRIITLVAVFLSSVSITARQAEAVIDTVTMPGQPNSCFVDLGEPQSEISLSAVWTPPVTAAVSAVSVKVDANDVDPPTPAGPEGEIDEVSLNGVLLGTLVQGVAQSVDSTTVFNLTPGQISAIFGVTTSSLTLTADIDIGTGTDPIVYCLKIYDIEVTIEWVQANSPPSCLGAEPSVETIWSPDHKLVGISVLGVTDADGDAVTISITGIRQDEPVNGSGDGNTAPDGAGIGTTTAFVRAERAGGGDGRVYHVSFSADDGNGGTCIGTVLVSVPRNQGPGGAVIDGGALFDSTQP
jgi:hypothetical protein